MQLLLLLLRDTCTVRIAGMEKSEGPQKSNYRAVIDPEECISCGACIERCPVDAISEDEDRKGEGGTSQVYRLRRVCDKDAQPTRS